MFSTNYSRMPAISNPYCVKRHTCVERIVFFYPCEMVIQTFEAEDPTMYITNGVLIYHMLSINTVIASINKARQEGSKMAKPGYVCGKCQKKEAKKPAYSVMFLKLNPIGHLIKQEFPLCGNCHGETYIQFKAIQYFSLEEESDE